MISRGRASKLFIKIFVLAILTMIKALIIDDDKGCIETLNELCKKHLPQLTILGSANTIAQGGELIAKFQPDLVFLDVELKGEYGFDLFKNISQPRFKVIFTTAHEKYALKAIKASCLEFLLKPIDPVELKEAVAKFEKHREQSFDKKIEALLSNLGGTNNAFPKIIIPSADSHTFLSVNEIVCCEADMNYTNVFTDKGIKIVSTKNLKEFEETLDASVFFRCHKSWLVNLNFIKKFLKSDSQLIMANDMCIDVSVRKKEEFLSLFKKF